MIYVYDYLSILFPKEYLRQLYHQYLLLYGKI